MSFLLQSKCDKFVKYADSIGWRVAIWYGEDGDSDLIYFVNNEHRWLKDCIMNDEIMGSNTFEHYCVHCTMSDRLLTSFEAKILSLELLKLNDLCSAWNSLNIYKNQVKDGSVISCLKKSYHNLGKRLLTYKYE